MVKKKVVKKAVANAPANNATKVVKKAVTPGKTAVTAKTVTTTKAKVAPAAPASKTKAAVKTKAAPQSKTAPASKNSAKVAPATKKNAVATKKAPVATRPTVVQVTRGAQITQDQFISQFRTNVNMFLAAMGEDLRINNVLAKAIKAAYSVTLKQVTDVNSYQDTIAEMFYARRFIQSRLTAPPLAADGLKTWMAGHFEVKLRKIIGDDADYKYFGHPGEEEGTFDAIALLDDEGNVIREAGLYNLEEIEASVLDGEEGEVCELPTLTAEEIEVLLPAKKEAPTPTPSKATTKPAAKVASKKKVAAKQVVEEVEDEEEELIEETEDVVDEDGEIIDEEIEEDENGLEPEYDNSEDIEGSGEDDEEESESEEDDEEESFADFFDDDDEE